MHVQVKARAVKEAKAIIKSNDDGYRSGIVKLVPAKTMVVIRCRKKTQKPFLIAMTLEATDPSKGGDHKIKVQWWTAEKLPTESPTCYQGPVHCTCGIVGHSVRQHDTPFTLLHTVLYCAMSCLWRSPCTARWRCRSRD